MGKTTRKKPTTRGIGKKSKKTATSLSPQKPEENPVNKSKIKKVKVKSLQTQTRDSSETLRPYNREASRKFLTTAARVFGWRDLSREVVLDIGCGFGHTSRAIVHKFPNVRKVIAIDICKKFLKKAAEINWHRKIQYEYADITNLFTLASWSSVVDKVISVFCFNCDANPIDSTTCYRNLFTFMKHGAEAALLLCPQQGYVQFVKDIVEAPKWKEYLKNLKGIFPPSFFVGNTAEYWRKMFYDIGFEVISCNEIPGRSWSYACDEQCKDHITRELSSLIPDDLKEEFKEEAFDVFVKYNTRDSQGRITMTHTCFAAFLRKPGSRPYYRWKPTMSRCVLAYD